MHSLQCWKELPDPCRRSAGTAGKIALRWLHKTGKPKNNQNQSKVRIRIPNYIVRISNSEKSFRCQLVQFMNVIWISNSPSIWKPNKRQTFWMVGFQKVGTKASYSFSPSIWKPDINMLLHQVCTSEGSACLDLRRMIFDDVMSYNSLTTICLTLHRGSEIRKCPVCKWLKMSSCQMLLDFGAPLHTQSFCFALNK